MFGGLDRGMPEHTRDNSATQVLGGTGETGRRVAQWLMVRGVPTWNGSRSGRPPFDWEGDGPDLRRGMDVVW